MRPASHSQLVEALTAALHAHGCGALDDAERWLDVAARLAPAHPDLLHLRGLVALGKHQPGKAVEWLERATRASPRTPMYWNNLGVAHRMSGALDAAAAAHRQALGLRPDYASALNNLGAVEAQLGDYATAARSFAKALSLGAHDGETRENLAKAQLCLGRFGDAWSHYRYRDPRPGAAPTQPLPADLNGHVLRIAAEQGIGDQLFFLRFADRLRARGGEIVVSAVDAIRPMLARAGLPRATGGEAVSVAMGDLPWLLGCGDGDLPPPLTLTPLPDRVAQVVETLAALPKPLIGVTWRAGGVKGRHDTTKLVPPEAIGAVLRAARGTVVSVQRLPNAGEHAAIVRALGRDVLDLSDWNDDLELMLALMAELDGYVGVSNANLHLRCGVARASDILVPFPMDWRWRTTARGEVPWYPGCRAYHQQPDGDWSVAFARLETVVRERWG